ncbi:sodium:solute symporter family protein [bacterium]|nr:MAG: sodium:solute symporter family protein [bacterium]
MSTIDYALILVYFLALLVITFWGKKEHQDETNYILAGRKLTLPAFVATLVSTWYGGILGVGEYGYSYGISQWVVFGFPYYIFAILFAFFLVKPIRKSSSLSLPEAIEQTYGKTARKIGALFVFLLTSPAPYIVMLALLFKLIIGIEADYTLYAIGVTLFSLLYVWKGGFSAVVRTDMLQLVLMYLGFAVLVFFGLSRFDGITSFVAQIPETHTNPTGGQSVFYVMVWFFLALWTFVDPGFHQRVAAAKDEKTAKRGIIISVIFWLVFDSLTMITSLLGVVLLPDLNEPILVYPQLAMLLLPDGFRGVFYLGLLATIMSTLDSFLFLSGQSLGRDGFVLSKQKVKSTQLGIVISGIIGIVLSVVFPSVISLWIGIGSVVIPGLLLTVLGSFIPFFRINKSTNQIMMFSGFISSSFWLTGKELGYSFFQGIEAFYPGLFVVAAVWLYGKRTYKP